nr:lysosomal Pro-X carboxypeptidase-like [Ipomoea batatas]
MFQWLLLLAFLSVLVLANSHNLPGFRHVRRNLGEDDTIISSSLQTFYYNQTLDHFNFQPQSFATFPQRYMIDSTHWGGAHKNAPIFVFLGLEESLDESLKFVGFLSQNAPRFKALIVYIEMCSDWVMTINFDNDATVPPPPFNLERYVKQCESFYGVPPRPHWMTTYFGGHDIKLVLKRFGSNIIFTNGLRDPWSGGGYSHILLFYTNKLKQFLKISICNYICFLVGS